MKETLKVSIGGLAFTIEKDAYKILDNYLNSLKKHYQDKEEGSEIVSDVEARLGELLMIKSNSSNSIVTIDVAHEIINIMGCPSDFDDEEETVAENFKNNDKKQEMSFAKKRFFKDPTHAVLGGVCSGLGYYFRMDPVIIRLIFIIAVIIGHAIDNTISMFIILLYLAIWIIAPKAKTFHQKLSMVGDDPSLEGMMKEGKTNFYNPNNSRIGSTLIQIIKITTAVIMLILGLAILVSIIAAIYLSWIGYPFMPDTSINELLSFWGMGSFDLKFSLILLLLLPAFVLIYLGIRLLKKITMRDAVVVGIVFIFWIGSVIYIGSVTTNIITWFNISERANDYTEFKIDSDTLYISYDSKYLDSDPVFDSSNPVAYRLDGRAGEKKYFIPPKVSFTEDSTISDCILNIEKTVFERSKGKARRKAEKAKLNYEIKGSSLIVSPQLFSNKDDFNRELFKLNLTVPKNKVVIVDPMFDVW